MSNVVTRYFKDCATDIKERALQRNYLKLKGLEQPILMICEFSSRYVSLEYHVHTTCNPASILLQMLLLPRRTPQFGHSESMHTLVSMYTRYSAL
jgi:hypothetical protein